nr:PREDICTED: uncharacterized protein LOC109038437 [Bemisia tabaci]
MVLHSPPKKQAEGQDTGGHSKHPDTIAQLQQATERNRILQDEMKLTREEIAHYHLELAKMRDSVKSSVPPTTAFVNQSSKQIKLPAFLSEKPDLWFNQIEPLFQIHDIESEATKYAYVVGQIEGKWILEIEDLIRTIAAVNPHSKLKAEIIERFSLSENSRVRKLMAEVELGDSTPSQFLRRLQSLAGNTRIQDNLMKTLWLQRPPDSIQGVLQAQPDSVTLTQLATIADRIAETLPAAKSVCATSSNSRNFTSDAIRNDKSDSLEDMKKAIAAMASQMEQLTKQVQSLQKNKPRYRSRSRQRYPSNSRQSSPNKNGFCFYHDRFGPKAYKCEQPCKFRATNETDSQ